MATQKRTSLDHPPHEWLQIQNVLLNKERKIQAVLFRFDNPDLVSPPPTHKYDPDPAAPMTPPHRIAESTWTSTVSRSRSGTRARPKAANLSSKGPAAHLMPPRPLIYCNSNGEIVQRSSPEASPSNRASSAASLPMLASATSAPGFNMMNASDGFSQTGFSQTGFSRVAESQLGSQHRSQAQALDSDNLVVASVLRAFRKMAASS
eukprot:CAMPEP_0197634378 /NCGR_PEP_ID=MMETSP1338-20131121/10489_1 /TAXON_ID=43686 ORGANISM="Pelagodinium beii, Strain RCC1491" /NCGR_SAMPLE_ID=MMETSP1338 /ASSEMBLY_ACC=CAM_ASM_000754 /LENGTH=205 /DNA_ID=CAMNT_0043206231 /DNA_START=63 /DNA_END=681 /DNA_ORIENTATION=-